MGDFGDRSYFGTKAVFETDVRKGHDQRLVVNCFFIMSDGDRVAFSAYKPHVGSPDTLPQPDVTHGRELELAHHDFWTFAEIQSAGDAVNARRNAGDNGNFVGAGIDELRECGTRGFIVFNPTLPG